jgi:BirA family biotin operon repressor/biotin-[acetyl-CoA-carboxylase] ligase
MKNEILSRLPASYPWRGNIHYFDTIDSTNTQAKRMAADGAPHGTVLIADTQTGGRGRMGRSFHSPGGVGIYFSVILRPQCHATEMMHLTCATAVAACNAVEKTTGLRPGIKLTNDLVHGKHKLGGILTELGLNPNGTVDYAIIGIGINCCQKETDFAPDIQGIAGSLSMVTGREIDRARVAAAMMEALFHMDQKLLSGKSEILERYREDCITVGQDISLLRGDAVRHGHALTVDEEGALVVLFPDGSVEAVNSGEVSVRGMYGYL